MARAGPDTLTGVRRFDLQATTWLSAAALAWATACASPPVPQTLPASSSLLAVDVRFPTPLARDHSLVEVFFVRGAIDADASAPPELVPASFVKRSRAYLVDPVPGSYAVAAVGSNIAPSWIDDPVAGGVTRTVDRRDPGHVVILPRERIEATRTEVRAGEVAYVGDLRVRRGDRIHAGAQTQGALQAQIAEAIRPGVTTEAGFGGWVSMTWTPDLEHTRLLQSPELRRAFFEEAIVDLEPSAWAGFVESRAPREVIEARVLENAVGPPVNPSPRKRRTLPAPSPPEAPTAPETAAETDRPDPADAPPAAESAVTPNADPPPGVPPDSPLAQISIGMHHGTVSRILGEPDERVDRLTATAWIPFNTGRGARLIDWIYDGVGVVTFSVETGTLRVYEVVPDAPHAR